MKQVLFIMLSLKTVALIAQQSEIKGIISIHNSEYETGKRQYVPNAQVEDDFVKATPQLTDANGNFKLVFVRVPEKTSVQLIVKKEDLQVVNIDGLSAVTGQRDLVRLSMAKPDKIAEYRRQIYQVGKTEAEKNLTAQLKKKGEQITTLQKDAVKNKTAIEKLQKEYAELQAFASKIEEQAQDLARRYAPINLDDAAPLYRESFKFFQEGELGQALQILRGANLVNQANKILAEEHAISNAQKELINRDSIKEQRKKDLMQVLGLKADLHKAKFEWDSVLFCLELRVNLDSTNVDNIWNFAGFLSEQNKLHEATVYYEKALALAQSLELKAIFLNNLGLLYRNNQKMAQAETAFQEALKIERQLVDNDPRYLLHLEANTLTNLGLLYKDNQKMAEAEASFLKALKIYRQLAGTNPDAVLSYMASTLNSLGNYYRDNQKMAEAEASFLEALKIRRQLTDTDPDPDSFLPDLAHTLNDLGEYYRINQKMAEAAVAYMEALKIRRQLADKNPDAFLEYVAGTLNNLGNYYRANQNMSQAEASYLETLKIYRQLANNNPDAFLPYVASTMNNLGEYYRINQKMSQAEAPYLEALKIYRQLADKNPDAFSHLVAMTLNNLGTYYYANQKMAQAEAAFLEALKIKRQLADKNPDAFSPDVAITLHNLGGYYYNNQKMSQAEAAFNEALKIRQQLADKNPDAFLTDLAGTLNNLGAYYMTNQKMAQAEAAFLEALKIRRQLADKNPDTFLPDLAETFNNLGIYYGVNQKMAQAEAAFLEALKVRGQLADKNPDAFLSDLAGTLNNLGVFFKNSHNYKSALEYYEKSLRIQETIILDGGIHEFNNWVQLLRNISDVKDSVMVIMDYKNLSETSRLLAESYDKMKEVNEKLKPFAVSEYIHLSFWALFAKNYALAEKAALRCIELDNSQEWILTILGHSQLLIGEYKQAFITYEKLKGKKDSKGQDYKQVLLNLLNTLEGEGITHKDFAQARAAIEKW